MKKKWLFILLLVSSTLLLSFAYTDIRSTDILRVSFFDVGQGDAIFIESPGGNQVLIDGGNADKKVLYELRKEMSVYDRFIDLVIATHPDQDHIGGLTDVLGKYQVGAVIDSGILRDTTNFKLKEKIIDEKEISRISARQGQRIFMEDDITVDVLFPDRSLRDVDPNVSSIILKLIYGEVSFLFTGDSPKSIEEYVLKKYGDFINVDVLKVGHHGSKTSSSELFLGLTSPEYAVVSAGADNRYGHPHIEVLDNLKKFETKVLQTSELGTITFLSDGTDLWLE